MFYRFYFINEEGNELIKHVYALSIETLALIPFYENATGKVKTKIMELGGVTLSGLNPIEIMDANLKFSGSSLTGAGQGTKHILGKVKMHPVTINERVWFPVFSPKKDGCIWLALNHIKRYSAYGSLGTIITFTSGTELIMDITVSTFERRMNRACALKAQIEYYTFYMRIPPKEKRNYAKYEIIKEENSINYQINRKTNQKVKGDDEGEGNLVP